MGCWLAKSLGMVPLSLAIRLNQAKADVGWIDERQHPTLAS